MQSNKSTVQYEETCFVYITYTVLVGT